MIVIVAKRTAARKQTTRKTSTRKTPTAKRSTAGKAVAKRKTAKVVKQKTAARAAATRSRSARPVPAPSRLSSAAAVVGGAAGSVVAVVAKRLPWGRAKDDAIQLLETDHRRFEKLLKEGEKTTGRAVKGRAELLETLTAELNLHEMIEEKVLYPALEPHAVAREVVLEGYEEHHVADVILKELHDVETDDEKWGAKFKVLKESIEHHIQEEENVMFKTARGILSRKELRDLGRRMRALKAERSG